MKWWWAALPLLITMLAGGCRDLTSPPPGEPSPDEVPEQELFDATIHFYQNDRLSATLEAGRIRKYAKRSIVLLDSSVSMQFFDSTGRRTTTLTADSGRADEARKDMVAMGHVVAVSDSGQMLKTDLLRWDNRNRRIITEAPVKLTTPTDTIDGVGFISDEHLKNWQIMQPTGKTFREYQRPEPRPFLEPADTTVKDST